MVPDSTGAPLYVTLPDTVVLPPPHPTAKIRQTTAGIAPLRLSISWLPYRLAGSVPSRIPANVRLRRRGWSFTPVSGSKPPPCQRINRVRDKAHGPVDK